MNRRYIVIWLDDGCEVGRRTMYDCDGVRAFADEKRRQGFSVEIE